MKNHSRSAELLQLLDNLQPDEPRSKLEPFRASTSYTVRESIPNECTNTNTAPLLDFACGLTQIQVVGLAKALSVSTDELLGLKTPRTEPAHEEDSETRCPWKRFQLITQLPEKDQRAVIRLINSLAAITPRRNSIGGERNGR